MGADPAVASLLDTMMAQLLSKDVLYEPLQQISARVRPVAPATQLRWGFKAGMTHIIRDTERAGGSACPRAVRRRWRASQRFKPRRGRRRRALQPLPP